ncbi:MAG TPA: heavy-metal-associated domain-containing protein [Micromonosporaceae bacterium]
MITNDYTVKGMTCDHCAMSVTSEVKAIPGVTAVRVDIKSGLVSVTADTPIAESRLREAVEEAGYELATTG